MTFRHAILAIEVCGWYHLLKDTRRIVGDPGHPWWKLGQPRAARAGGVPEWQPPWEP
jgi:hypothetical protein